ncbi:MAG TPA: hypothetical protein PLW86_16865 [Rhodocyclaceae bacterium]|nr:hypothetical protein [Rhodocyclaceae bacterium]
MRFMSILLLLFLLAGCDQLGQKLGLEDPAKKEAKADAEGKAVGSACRQSGRAIEDCYSIYGWLPKSSIFEGWREMDTYMRENKIETIAPQLPPPEPPGTRKKKVVIPEKNNSVPEIKLERSSDKPLDAAPEKPAEKTETAPAASTGAGEAKR